VTPLRAAAHVHSEWSDDAHWPLARIADAFGQRGYQAVLLSEHSRGLTAAQWDDYRVACAQASTDDVLLVPGIEYNDPDNVVHVPVWGDLPFFGAEPDTAELLAQVAVAGGTSVLAHPWRREAWRRVQPAWAAWLTGVEVWNRKYDGIAPNPRALALARQHNLRPFVAVDFHTSRQFFPLAVSLTVETTTVDAVYAALAAGRFEPTFRSHSVTRVSTGTPAHALRALELTRRAVRPAVRAARRLRG
jgi:hypothetical protein